MTDYELLKDRIKSLKTSGWNRGVLYGYVLAFEEMNKITAEERNELDNDIHNYFDKGRDR